MECTDKKERDRLLKKAYEFNMALIYLYGCNSNEMRMDFAKAYGNRHDNYPCTLEEICNVHRIHSVSITFHFVKSIQILNIQNPTW